MDIEECFQSVSDGKSLVAAAITDKGVTTAADASFSVMADNINNISSSFTIKTAMLATKSRNLHWNTPDPTWDVTSYVAKGAVFYVTNPQVKLDSGGAAATTDPIGLALTRSGNTLKTYLYRTGNQYSQGTTIYITPVAIWAEKV